MTLDQPPACHSIGCPLAGKAKGFVLGAGDPGTAKFSIVLESPYREEVAWRDVSEAELRLRVRDYSHLVCRKCSAKAKSNAGTVHTLSQEIKDQMATRQSSAESANCDRDAAQRSRLLSLLPPNVSNSVSCSSCGGVLTRELDFEPQFYLKGEPVVGRSGAELFGWALKALAVRREDVFLDNTIRCALSLREPSYPTGATRKRAEACCRQFDRFHADVGLVSIHPAALTREPTPLPVQIRTFEKAIDFSRQGLRVVVLAGGKAAEWWFGAPRNPMRWIGHYEVETDATRQRREERRLEGMETKVEEKREKKPKVRKLKAKEALAMLLGKVRPGTPGLIAGVYEDYALNCTLLCSEFEEMMALVKPKKKVS